MKAWDALVRGSTLTEGTASDHILHQGSSGDSVFVLGMGSNIDAMPMEASIVSGSVLASILDFQLKADTPRTVLGGVLSNLELSATIATSTVSANMVEEVL